MHLLVSSAWSPSALSSLRACIQCPARTFSLVTTRQQQWSTRRHRTISYRIISYRTVPHRILRVPSGIRSFLGLAWSVHSVVCDEAPSPRSQASSSQVRPVCCILYHVSCISYHVSCGCTCTCSLLCSTVNQHMPRWWRVELCRVMSCRDPLHPSHSLLSSSCSSSLCGRLTHSVATSLDPPRSGPSSN